MLLRFFAIIKRKRNCTYSMNRTITYLISDKDAGFTIEQNLRHRGYSPKHYPFKKTPESVLLNGIWVHMTHRLTSGDELGDPDCRRAILQTSSSGRTSHPYCLQGWRYSRHRQAGRDADPPSFEQLLQFSGNALAWYFEQQKKPLSSAVWTGWSVGDTSGLTIIAKHVVSAAISVLHECKTEIHREYRAIVRGHLLGIRCHYRSAWQKRQFHHWAYRRFWPRRKSSHLLSVSGRKTATKPVSHSGWERTHPSDPDSYEIHRFSSGRKTICTTWYEYHRQALHSYRLTFLHPITGQNGFYCPLPDDMKRSWTDCRIFLYICCSVIASSVNAIKSWCKIRCRCGRYSCIVNGCL